MKEKISELQKQIIIGTILGDGYIHQDRYGGCRLEIKHKNKHKNYVFWIYKRLKNICPGVPRQRKDNNQWRFVTGANDDIKQVKNIFYRKNQKIVPKNISEILISSLSLAIWYMDDGSLDFRPKSHYAFSLKTNSFTFNECKLLVKTLEHNFKIKTSIHNPICRGKRYPQIYIGKDGRNQFLKLIEPYVIDCFQYKLPPL